MITNFWSKRSSGTDSNVNRFEFFISEDPKLRHQWIALLPIAHAHTLFIAHRLQSNLEDIMLSIAIVGGGIGGLALAVTLKKLGVEDKITLDVYESAAKLSQVGAGVTMWPRAWQIMKNLRFQVCISEVKDVSKWICYLDLWGSGNKESIWTARTTSILNDRHQYIFDKASEGAAV
ncbi:hypothetical protein CPC08DRAFT_729153 [Agrocybe pediades]|nr:hypothetical protein CPC08DRAFT_729153 [Agrocybe pediades]